MCVNEQVSAVDNWVSILLGIVGDWEEYLPQSYFILGRKLENLSTNSHFSLLQTAPTPLPSWCVSSALSIGLAYSKGQRMPSGRRSPVLALRGCGYTWEWCVHGDI